MFLEHILTEKIEETRGAFVVTDVKQNGKNNLQASLILTGEAEDSLDMTGMLLLTSMENIDLNTMLLWKSTLEEDLKKGNTFITKMEIKRITELKTLSFSILKNMRKTIALVVTQINGLRSGAYTVENLLRDVEQKLKNIQTLFVQKIASKRAPFVPFRGENLLGTESEIKKGVLSEVWLRKLQEASLLDRWSADLVLTHSEECNDACAPDCPMQILDKQSGTLESGFIKAGTRRANLCGYRGAMPALTLHDTYGDSGGASRFFYCAKVSRSERWGWCRECSRVVLPKELDVHREEGHGVVVHPTQKPLELMRWFVRLVTPPGGLVLDPFAGSGATLVAAVLEGFRCIGVEADPEYASIAEARVKAACREKVSAAVLVGDGMEQLTFF